MHTAECLVAVLGVAKPQLHGVTLAVLLISLDQTKQVSRIHVNFGENDDGEFCFRRPVAQQPGYSSARHDDNMKTCNFDLDDRIWQAAPYVRHT